MMNVQKTSTVHHFNILAKEENKTTTSHQQTKRPTKKHRYITQRLQNQCRKNIKSIKNLNLLLNLNSTEDINLLLENYVIVSSH